MRWCLVWASVVKSAIHRSVNEITSNLDLQKAPSVEELAKGAERDG
jgi:hypothetical protein